MIQFDRVAGDEVGSAAADPVRVGQDRCLVGAFARIEDLLARQPIIELLGTLAARA